MSSNLTRIRVPNKDALRLWVQDLRRNYIIQGSGLLTQIRDGERQDCCLGRACQVALERGIIGEPVINLATTYRPGVTTFQYGEEGRLTDLPDEVAEWLGIENDPWLDIDDDGDDEAATALNDTYGWTFEQIADAIERTYDL